MSIDVPVPRQKLRVLVLEDNQTDADLFMCELQRAGIDSIWTRVETESSFLAALDPLPDVILADFALPQFDGLRALEFVRGRGLDTPFLLISGDLNDATAVQAIQRGADDYLLKDRLHRLGPAVLRALESKRLRAYEKLAREKLRVRDAQYQSLVRSVPVAVYTCDIQGRVTGYNEAAAKLWGREPELNRDLWSDYCQLFQSDGRPLPSEDSPMAMALRSGEMISDREVLIEGSDGVRHKNLVYLTPLKDEFGEIAGVVNVLVDVTTQSGLDASAQQDGERFRAAVQHAGVGVAVNETATGRFVTINDRFCEIVGRSQEQLIALTYLDVIHPGDSHVSNRLLNQLMAGRLPHFNIDKRYVLPDAAEVWCNVSISSASQTNQQPAYVIAVAMDISERKAAEKERLDHELALAHVARLSVAGELISGIAHEINQPLTAIVNFADACYEGLKAKTVDFEQQLRLTKQIMDQALRAGEIIRRLRGLVCRSDLKKSPIDLRDNIAQMLRFIETEAHLNGVILETVVPDFVPTVIGDAILIQQLLLNLVRNAIDAQISQTDAPKQILIEVAAVSDEFVEVIVSDNGKVDFIGELDQLFESFFTTKQNGMGLGLPISRSIAQAHQGTLFAHKRPIRGMAFHLALPIGSANSESNF